MTTPTCNFVWYELMTNDTAAAKDFYGAVVGWNTQAFGEANSHYTLFTLGENGVAGLMAIPENACDAGSRPCWTGYIAVDDVDAYVERIQQAGGKVHRAPEDIPTVGRFAVVADPHGAVFMLIKPIGEAPAERPAPNTPGLVGWRELHAGNGPEAFEFYSQLFGWSKDTAMDMGDLGVYQLFAIDGVPSGGMMTKMPDLPHPFWLYYFNVTDINAAIATVQEKGGQVLMGPHEVPGGSWIVQGMDPQGAMFALVQPGPGF